MSVKMRSYLEKTVRNIRLVSGEEIEELRIAVNYEVKRRKVLDPKFKTTMGLRA